MASAPFTKQGRNLNLCRVNTHIEQSFVVIWLFIWGGKNWFVLGSRLGSGSLAFVWCLKAKFGFAPKLHGFEWSIWFRDECLKFVKVRAVKPLADLFILWHLCLVERDFKKSILEKSLQRKCSSFSSELPGTSSGSAMAWRSRLYLILCFWSW